MTARKIRRLVVFAPIHPDYRERYPKVAGWLDNLVRDLRMATVDDDTHILQLSDDGHFKADDFFDAFHLQWPAVRSEEHTSELQSLMRISYAVFCLKKKKHIYTHINNDVK